MDGWIDRWIQRISHAVVVLNWFVRSFVCRSYFVYSLYCIFSLVVGHLPVLKPGQCLEYMSGSDLATPKGIMKGHFYMAWVPPGSPSVKAGDDIDFLNLQEEDKLQVTVAPFSLEAE
jgi:hypothetical protein